MTISGELSTLGFAPLELLPISKGQKYLVDLEAELSLADGTPLWFVHDGQTGTSHDFVCAAQNHFSEHGTIEGTLLLRFMEACVDTDCVFRIWYESDQPACHQNLAEFISLQELRLGISRMLSEGHDISLRRRRRTGL